MNQKNWIAIFLLGVIALVAVNGCEFLLRPSPYTCTGRLETPEWASVIPNQNYIGINLQSLTQNPYYPALLKRIRAENRELEQRLSDTAQQNIKEHLFSLYLYNIDILENTTVAFFKTDLNVQSFADKFIFPAISSLEKDATPEILIQVADSYNYGHRIFAFADSQNNLLAFQYNTFVFETAVPGLYGAAKFDAMIRYFKDLKDYVPSESQMIANAIDVPEEALFVYSPSRGYDDEQIWLEHIPGASLGISATIYKKAQFTDKDCTGIQATAADLQKALKRVSNAKMTLTLSDPKANPEKMRINVSVDDVPQFEKDLETYLSSGIK